MRKLFDSDELSSILLAPMRIALKDVEHLLEAELDPSQLPDEDIALPTMAHDSTGKTIAERAIPMDMGVANGEEVPPFNDGVQAAPFLWEKSNARKRQVARVSLGYRARAAGPDGLSGWKSNGTESLKPVSMATAAPEYPQAESSAFMPLIRRSDISSRKASGWRFQALQASPSISLETTQSSPDNGADQCPPRRIGQAQPPSYESISTESALPALARTNSGTFQDAPDSLPIDNLPLIVLRRGAKSEAHSPFTKPGSQSSTAGGKAQPAIRPADPAVRVPIVSSGDRPIQQSADAYSKVQPLSHEALGGDVKTEQSPAFVPASVPHAQGAPTVVAKSHDGLDIPEFSRVSTAASKAPSESRAMAGDFPSFPRPADTGLPFPRVSGVPLRARFPQYETMAGKPSRSGSFTEQAPRLAQAVEPTLAQAYKLNQSQGAAPGSVRNVFNVNVALHGGQGSQGLDLLELQQALADVLNASARRHGLEI